MVPLEALHVANVQKTKLKTPVSMAGGQLHKPLGNELIFITQLWLITITRLTDRKR